MKNEVQGQGKGLGEGSQMAYKDFTQMSVWQSALRLLILIYEVTKQYPSDEKFGIVPDMRRAANSVTHNIAEGYGRYEPKDKTRFYKISRGSSYEIISQTIASHKLGFIERDSDEIIILSKRIIDELDSLIFTHEHRKKP